MIHRTALIAATLVAAAALSTGCGGGSHKPAATPATAAGATCMALGTHVARFAEVLEDVAAVGKGRRISYASVLEVLLTFERASGDLEAQIATMRGDDPAIGDVLKRTGTALAQANEFARTERERIDQHAASMAPLAKDTDAAYAELRATCEAKPASRQKPPRECAAVLESLHAMEVGGLAGQVAREQLATMRLNAPPVARARDRAVAATVALTTSAEAQAAEMAELAKRWAATENSVGSAFEAFATQCASLKVKNAPEASGARLLAEAKPDLRKLTLLVRVKPPAGIDDAFQVLAERAKDDETRAFFQARSRGAFGSGFVIVRATANGAGEVLVITNRHVVELADRAALELADGTSLGAADIVYTDPVHDVAVLRPAKKLPFEKGFAFAASSAKDQQGVIATGFPGMGGRPSYQTTRGYVSNESFRIEESARPQVFVQHTAPIDPGSSGGPLTDEGGFVLGINTLKVSNREAVGLAVPSDAILEVLRRSDAAEAKRASATFRRESARLACLGLVSELASKKPRLLLLETKISNNLTSAEGLDAAMAIDDADFGQIWQADSVRAMRIATLVRLGTVLQAAGGASLLETCSEANADDVRDILSADEVRYRIRLGNWEMREIALRWEQGHWKLARIDLKLPKPPAAAAKPPAAKPKKKK